MQQYYWHITHTHIKFESYNDKKEPHRYNRKKPNKHDKKNYYINNRYNAH